MKEAITLKQNPKGGFDLQKDGETCFCKDSRPDPCNSLCPLFVISGNAIQIKCGGTIADYKAQ